MSAASASRSAVGIDAARDGELGGHQHPVADRLAVAEAPVLRDRLERVAGGVAEVQRAPQARFALVLLDDRRLDPAGLGR